MTFLFLTLGALCELFLLRFVLALGKEISDASRQRNGHPLGLRQAKESGETIRMRFQFNIEKKSPKSAALVIIGALALALPLHDGPAGQGREDRAFFRLDIPSTMRA